MDNRPIDPAKVAEEKLESQDMTHSLPVEGGEEQDPDALKT